MMSIDSDDVFDPFAGSRAADVDDVDPFDGEPLYPRLERTGMSASDPIEGVSLGGASPRPGALRMVRLMGERRYGYGFTGRDVRNE